MKKKSFSFLQPFILEITLEESYHKKYTIGFLVIYYGIP